MNKEKTAEKMNKEICDSYLSDLQEILDDSETSDEVKLNNCLEYLSKIPRLPGKYNEMTIIERLVYRNSGRRFEHNCRFSDVSTIDNIINMFVLSNMFMIRKELTQEEFNRTKIRLAKAYLRDGEYE